MARADDAEPGDARCPFGLQQVAVLMPGHQRQRRVEVVPHASIEGRCHLDMINRQAHSSPDAGDHLGLELLEVRNQGIRRFEPRARRPGLFSCAGLRKA